jgi:predicted methyltransferase
MSGSVPTSDVAPQRKYLVRIAIFLAGVVACVVLLNAIYTTINTLARLELVEAERDQWQRPRDILAELKLQNGAVVADIGSGVGYFALKLSRGVGSSGKVFAVDIRKTPLMLLWLRALLAGRHNIRILLGSPDDPHLPVGILDAALIVNAYHEFSAPASILGHLFEALRSGGRSVILDRSSAPGGFSEEEGQHHEIPPDRVDTQLRQSGFRILNRQDRFIDRPTGEQWWMIAAQKAPR